MLSGRGRTRHAFSGIGQMLSVPVLLFSAITAAAQTTDNTVRIHRYSSFSTLPGISSDQSVSSLSGDTLRSRTPINVYGKRLMLDLESNARLINQLPKAGNQIALLRGTLEGNAKSWVRITKTSEGTHGLIWDGTELYVVEPGSAVASALAVSLPRPDSATVIFKSSDTTMDLGSNSCASEAQSDVGAVQTGLATYQALTTELSEQINNSSGGAKLRLEMQALADAAFRAQYSSDQAALDAIMVRLNNVDGIFTAQMGLEVQATDVRIYASDPGSLSQSTDANTLLNSLGQLRNSNPVMGTYGVTHLFTGRDLDGETLGIAYIGNICGARYGVSLSESRNRGAWIDSLVTAHELGHQLGAVHDGTGVCGGTPAQSYLMGEQINGSSELSQCSRQSILATMQFAACLVPVGSADMSLNIDTQPPLATPNTSFSWSLSIQNLGTGAAELPTVHVTLPASIVVEGSAIAGGSCVASNSDVGGTVDCVFDTLASNETRLLELGLRASSVGNYQITAEVGASSDKNPLNNNAVYYLAVTTTGVDTGSSIATATASTQSASVVNTGGGGSINILALLVIAGLASWRRLREHAV
jgi:Metallo-peptidase family M12/Domain of unknown function DUF11